MLWSSRVSLKASDSSLGKFDAHKRLYSMNETATASENLAVAGYQHRTTLSKLAQDLLWPSPKGD